MENELVTIYTTAPERFDYGYVEGREVSEYEVQHINDWIPLFRVRIPAESVDYQCGRYGSGLHPSYTQERLEDELQYSWLREAVV